MNTICLFKVTVKGFFGSQYKTVYVISDSLDDAYRTYRNFLDEKIMDLNTVEIENWKR